MNGLSNGANKTGDSCNDGLQADNLNKCTQLLGRFVDWFLQRPDILRASSYDRNRLAAELRLYILTQTIQCEDSKDILVRENTEQSTAVFDTAGKSFAAAFSTGIPHSLALMVCPGVKKLVIQMSITPIASQAQRKNTTHKLLLSIHPPCTDS